MSNDEFYSISEKDAREYIDELLKLFIDHSTVTHSEIVKFSQHTKLLKKSFPNLILTKMERLGIITRIGSGTTIECVLTEFGQRVIRHGSWTKYLYNNELLPVEMIDSSIRTNRLISKQSKIQTAILVLTLIVTGASVYVTWKSNGTETRLLLLEESLDSLKLQQLQKPSPSKTQDEHASKTKTLDSPLIDSLSN